MTKELFLGIRRKEQIITIRLKRSANSTNVFKRKRRKYATLEQRLRNIEQSMQK